MAGALATLAFMRKLETRMVTDLYNDDCLSSTDTLLDDQNIRQNQQIPAIKLVQQTINTISHIEGKGQM